MRYLFVLLFIAGLPMMLHAQEQQRRAISGRPLVTHIPTANAAAHVFNGVLYVYVSHDSEARATPESIAGYGLRDLHLLRLDAAGSGARDLGSILEPANVSWARMIAGTHDAAARAGRYFLYFGATDKAGRNRIGVAGSAAPEAPFRVEPKPVAACDATDPSVFRDDDGRHYMYFAAIANGQPKRAPDSSFKQGVATPAGNGPVRGAMIAKLSDDMISFAEQPVALVINDSTGRPLPADDHARRFFGSAHMHKYGERYFLTYTTEDPCRIVYATSRNPYGPFIYRGVLLPPLAGHTAHASVVAHQGRWYLFYHDCTLSTGGPQRCVKMAELRHDGTALSLAPIFNRQ